jgi:hypothetical protein
MNERINYTYRSVSGEQPQHFAAQKLKSPILTLLLFYSKFW